ncbi:MAG: tetratricopeptide repeat protein [Trichormus sp.]
MNGEQDKKKHISYGDDVKARVRTLLERFLAYANDELEDSELYKIALNWETSQQVIVETQLRVLAELSGLSKEEVREALKRLQDFVEILEDLRAQKRGSENWHFRLKFWHDKGDKEGNLQKFDAEWQRRREELPGVQRAEGRKTQPQPTRYENIPFSGVVEFVGRERELQNLHELLQKNQQVAIAAIAGMGGVGKTELAVQYANFHRVTYQGGICWLSAVQDVGVKLVEFAVNKLQLNIPDGLDSVGRVQYCLSNWREGEVLLVIDNVTHYGDEVRYYLESIPSRFKQLITTREKLQPPIVRLDLDVLTPLAAMQLLKSIIGEERLQHEQLIAEKLCQWLGYLPLGLELVGRYLLGDEELSLAEMLQDLEKERLKNPALDEARPEMKAELGVAAAFELSWRRLRENAQRLGCVLSLFALAPIPWELVEGVTINNQAQNWKKARRKLLQLHLLQSKGEGIYQLHPLLREFFQSKLTGLEQAEEFKRSFCEVMVGVAKSIPHPQSVTNNTITAVTPAVLHLEETAKVANDLSNDENSIWLFTALGRFYEGQGFYEQAEPWYKLCIEIADRPFSSAGSYRASSRNNLAVLYTFLGHYQRAVDRYEEALEINRLLLGEEHPDTVTNLNNLGYVYKAQKNYEKAKRIYVKALELRICLLGENHTDVASSLNNLAALYCEQGNYYDAELLCIKSIEINSINKDLPKLTFSLNNLANIYCGQHRYCEAEQKYLEVVTLRKTLFGTDHHQVAISLDQLAYLYLIQHRYNEAEMICLEALEIFEKRLGIDNPDTVMCRENLAYILDRLNPEQ